MNLRPKSNKAGKTLAAIGIVVVLTDLVLRIVSWWTHREYDLDHMIVLPGILMGFVGFWMIDSKKTKEAIEVVGEFVPRFGRRKTDPIATPETITHTIPIPTGEHAVVKTTAEPEKKDDGV